MISEARARRARLYLLWGGAIVAASLLATLFWAAPRGSSTVAWTAGGWLVGGGIGLVGGVWMNRVHGTTGSAFIVALGTCMLARLFAAAAVGGASVLAGRDAIWAFVVGLAAGFAPLQLFEVGWFHVLTRRLATGAIGVEPDTGVHREP